MKNRPNTNDNLEALYEVLYELNDTQIDRLTTYAYKLFSDKRYKKNKL